MMTFVSFLFIAQLEDIFYNFINSPLKDKLHKLNFIVEIDSKYETEHPKWQTYFMSLINTVISFLYETVYFYLFPYFIFLFVYLYTNFHDETAAPTKEQVE